MAAREYSTRIKATVNDVDLVAGIQTGSEDLAYIATSPVDLDGAVGICSLKACDGILVDLCLCLVLRPLCPVVDHDLIAIGSNLFSNRGFRSGGLRRALVIGSGLSIRCAGSHAENHQCCQKQCD